MPIAQRSASRESRPVGRFLRSVLEIIPRDSQKATKCIIRSAFHILGSRFRGEDALDRSLFPRSRIQSGIGPPRREFPLIQVVRKRESRRPKSGASQHAAAKDGEKP